MELSARVRCVCQIPPTLPGHSDIGLHRPPSTLLFPATSLSFFQLFVRLSPASFPSETRRPPNPRSNHRFFGYTFVILRPSRLLQIVLYKHVCRWLGPDISVVFIASPCFYVYPLNANVTSRLFFLIFPPIKFLLRSLPPVPHLLLLLSPFSSVRDRWQGPWCFIEELSNLSIPSVPFQTRPVQIRPDQTILCKLFVL